MVTQVTHGNACPACDETNNCRIAGGCVDQTACWCEQVVVPAPVLHYLAESKLAHSCLCRRCLTSVVRHATTLNEPQEILARVRAEIAMVSGAGD